jgi:methylenetetrahydrofolate dehydrogenase (NADP+)/methenyltetrahydrofolate cyclohydrolase
MAQMLRAADATVIACHSPTRDLPALCRQADVLVAAVGRPAMVGADWIKPGATVVEVGSTARPMGSSATWTSTRA